MGKTDGTVSSSGVRYFEAPGSNRGGLLVGRGMMVTTVVVQHTQVVVAAARRVVDSDPT